MLDLPTFGGEDVPTLARLAVFADPWPGPVTVWASSDGLSYSPSGVALAPSIVGSHLMTSRLVRLAAGIVRVFA